MRKVAIGITLIIRQLCYPLCVPVLSSPIFRLQWAPDPATVWGPCKAGIQNRRRRCDKPRETNLHKEQFAGLREKGVFGLLRYHATTRADGTRAIFDDVYFA